MSEWNQFVSNIQKHITNLAEDGCDNPFFRGHMNESWTLLCGLGRQQPDDFKKKNTESILYYDFMSLGGPLLRQQYSSWDVLFSMQHHGLPTRLLDWSSTFTVALYFAIKPYRTLTLLEPGKTVALKNLPCIWILDPFELNRATSGEAVVFNPHVDLEGSYQEIFIDHSKSLGSEVMAVNPTQTDRRLAAQRSGFTLHADLFKPLEQRSGTFLRKFVLPAEAICDALSFLALAGMNEYALFPDLDGLARHLRYEHVDWI